MFAKLANNNTEAEIAQYAAKHKHDFPAKNNARSKVQVQPVALTRQNLIDAARKGVQFLRDHAVKPDGQVYFALTREGKPFAVQRKPFAATFMIIALNEVAKATGEDVLRKEAIELLDRVLVWIRTPGALGRESVSGAPAFCPMNVPMILLNVIGELRNVSFSFLPVGTDLHCG
jgi:hypothetical protein